MRKVYLILGHPNKDSFNGKLVDAYEKRLKELKIEVRRVNLIDLDFDLILRKDKQEHQSTIEKEQANIMWADELIFFYPLWWGNVPALLKGYIDNVFTHGFAYKHHEDDPLWDKLLEGKKARIFSTCDASSEFVKTDYKDCDFIFLKKAVFWFTGIKTIETYRIGELYIMNDEEREKEINKIISTIKK
ncbi:putative NADPH-quinone reductase [Metamycoplasma subdolum]|uniref:Putative NADPH-quinone reductase n=1 Tax=Metamycoplasma subdolum TaxID=92407 RepID=A0A3M0A3G4_9BACT|nr:NAD(P)H-dependent oxidoreductase [Metamycoplasma subdolum]RMA78994.1 putative NADPH-quinone reductase [Metamycoplasma subdolum]WPB50517.1 NAD(P)H-dependent oxidoreductase [Metamycoplasma subdolum]